LIGKGGCADFVEEDCGGADALQTLFSSILVANEDEIGDVYIFVVIVKY
jgi:hypothetical protein